MLIKIFFHIMVSKQSIKQLTWTFIKRPQLYTVIKTSQRAPLLSARGQLLCRHKDDFVLFYTSLKGQEDLKFDGFALPQMKVTK